MKKRALVRKCKKAMADATTYTLWLEAALELDHHEEKGIWKKEVSSDLYNYQLIQKRLNQLRKCRQSGDINQLVYRLREGLHRNLGNIANPVLYRQANVGTKKLIESYVNEVAVVLEYLCDNEFKEFPFPQKIQFFEETAQSFGRSALLLSGGAAFGLHHIGVIKALKEHKLLPRVISGSSMGAVIAAALGSFSDLTKLYDLNNFALQMPGRNSLKHMFRTRSFMKNNQLEEALRENLGDLTFEEAFRKTGQLINITVSPAIKNHNSQLLNYLTYPHLYVWSAAMASCAVPGLFTPVQLKARSHQGREISYMPSLHWVDGALTNDLPLRRLAELFNVNHSIVSQVNPHVVPFMANQQRKPGLTAMGKNFLKTEGKSWGKRILKAAEFGVRDEWLVLLLGGMHGILNQTYTGDITVTMKPSPGQYLKLFKNPSVAEFNNFILEGERATWPQLTAINIQTKIGQTLEQCGMKLDRRQKKMGNKRAAVKLASVA